MNDHKLDIRVMREVLEFLLRKSPYVSVEDILRDIERDKIDEVSFLFSSHMRKKMKENIEEKVSWRFINPDDLVVTMHNRATSILNTAISKENAEPIAKQCINVANYAMMIYDCTRRVQEGPTK